MSLSTIEMVDSQLNSLQSQISMLIDPESLRNEFNLNKRVGQDDINQLQAKDEEISKELSELQHLWVLSNLFKEIEINLELYEFENVLYSFNKLKEKSKDLKDSLIVNDRIFKLDTTITKKISFVWNKLFNITQTTITYNADIEIDGNIITFDSIYEIIKSNKLPAQSLNSNVSRIIDTNLLSPLIDGSVLKLNNNSIEIIKPISEPTLLENLHSVKDLLLLVQQFPIHQSIVNYIQTRLLNWLKSVLTVNIEYVYNSSELQESFKELGHFFDEIGLKRNNVIKWIDNELNTIVIEYYLNSHIDKIRNLFQEVNQRNLFTDLITKDFENFKVKEKSKYETKKTELEKEDDGWGWGDDDIEFDDENDKKQESFKSEKGDDDDKWDAWGDDNNNDDDHKSENKEGNVINDDKKNDDDDGWDAWDDEPKVTPKPKRQVKKPLISKLSKHKTSSRSPTPRSPTPISQGNAFQDSIKITKIPEKIIKIFESYISTQIKVPTNYKEEHHSKLNYLATTYYILASNVFEKEPILFYNDLTFVLSSFKIPRLNELTDNLLLTTIESYETNLSKSFEQLKGLDPSLNSSETFQILNNLQYQLDSNIFQLNKLSNIKILNKVLISLFDQFYQNVIDNIMIKQSISEDESEYLNIIITKILDLQLNGYNHLKKIVKNFTKLNHINFILSNHMNEIMQNFYNAEFFDLETEEIISLIDKLFADSDLKKRNIEEIREIREAV